jgi:hypothetical protein
MKANYTCSVSFLTDEPLFAYGVEIGLLYARMKHRHADIIEDYFCRWNQDQITLMASRLSWQVVEMSRHSKHWLWIRLEKRTE